MRGDIVDIWGNEDYKTDLEFLRKIKICLNLNI